MKHTKYFLLFMAAFLLNVVTVSAEDVQPAAAEAEAEVVVESVAVEAAQPVVPTEVPPVAVETPVAAKVEAAPVATPEPVAPAVPAGAKTYSIDLAHSNVGFSVKHLQITNVTGKFKDYEGKVVFDPDNLNKFSADITIKAASIDTANDKRDEHLRGNDFFGADQFPAITFKSNRLEKRGEGYVMIGSLTIRGVTKEITFPVTINGPVKAMTGEAAIGIGAKTSINRQDYNVSWNKKLDNGGYILDDKVDLDISFELHEGK